MAAAAASASASLSSPFSLHTSDRSTLSSSKFSPIQNSCNQRRFFNPLKSISSTANSSFPQLKSYHRNWNSRIMSNKKPYSFAQKQSQPYQTNGEDGSVPENAADKRLPSLKLLVQAYKEAILNGDRKTIYEIEDIMLVVEKEHKELAQKVSAMSAEISSGKEKYLRLQADFDNYRKRSEKEKLTARSNAQGEVIESLLPMVDSFERAKQHIKIETEMEKKIDTSYQGIYKQFVEIMRSLRVAAVPTVGKPFDPSMHEAIAREESQEYKEGIVIQELRRGFYLGERLLRPAMVKVSSGPGKRKPQSVPEQEATSVAGFNSQ
ncbi:hypothetical protein ACJIZ3_002990 [Penstemon smallii]|uniref:GrpE protein homolog n=1 Tax=Penstemon smallii TaxID=265156 RepID=A0ABD3UBC1_9LAMI